MRQPAGGANRGALTAASRHFAAAASAWTLLLPGDGADLATGGRAFAPREAWDRFGLFQDRFGLPQEAWPAVPAAPAPAGAWRFDGVRDDLAHTTGARTCASAIRREARGFTWNRSGERTAYSLAVGERRFAASWQDRFARGATLAQDERRLGVSFSRDNERGTRAFGGAADYVDVDQRGAWGIRADAAAGRSPDGQSGLALRGAVWTKPLRPAFDAHDGAALFAFPLSWTQHGSSVELSAPIAGTLRMRACYEGGAVVEAGAGGRAEADNAFVLEPSLPWQAAKLELVARGQSGSWGLRYEKRSMEGRIDGYHDDVRFARAHHLEGNLERIAAGAERRLGAGHLLLVDAERLALSASARGEIQTWPFTPAIVDLFGARARYEAGLALRLRRLHAGGAHRLGPGWDLRWGVNHLAAQFDVHAATWETDLMVFGVNDLRRHRLDLRRAEGFLLTAGLGREVGPLRLDYTFLQAVPTRLVRDGDGAPSSPQDPGSASGSGGAHWSGGRLHALRVGWAR